MHMKHIGEYIKNIQAHEKRGNMANDHHALKNCIVLLMGFAGVGKLTIAKELASHPNFRLVDNHTWNNPIFNLINQDGITPLPETVWIKTGKICDVIFETMRELSPHDFSFVITQEMILDDEYPTLFYERVSQLATDRKAMFLPVRNVEKLRDTGRYVYLVIAS